MVPRAMSVLSSATWFKSRSRIFYLRLCVASSLLVVAVIFGYMTFTTLSNSEMKLAEEQYDAISDSTLRTVLTSFTRMKEGTSTLAKAYAHAHPEAKVWPNVTLNGFYDTVPNLVQVSSLSSLSLAPVVQKEKLASFNQFMINYFDNDATIPPNVATTPYGRGVWRLDATWSGVILETEDTLSHTESPYNHALPILQVVFNEANTPGQLGLNVHSEPNTGDPLDRAFTCGAENSKSFARTNCSTLGNALRLPAPSPVNPNPEVTGMQSFVIYPIVVDDPSQVDPVGLLAGSFNWAALFENSAPDFVNGLDIVVETNAGLFQEFTYRFEDGVPQFQGLGDLHDSTYDSYRNSADIFQTMTFVAGSNEYTISLYPRKEFFDEYLTQNPLYLAIGSVVLILLCSLIFVLYDRAVRHESTKKELVLDTKRRFVRFISHEIRTPMNTVKLGLKLFELELGALANQLTPTSMMSAEQIVSTLGETVTNWIQLTNDVLSNSEAAVDVLNDLLNYDKIEMGTLRLEFSSIPIWQLVKTTAAGFVMQAKQKEIDYVTRGNIWDEDGVEETLDMYQELHVVGDPGRISQILRNLLSNALKFTPEKGRVTIRVEWLESGLPVAEIEIPADQEELIQDPRSGSIAISVTDTGAGLSEEQLGEICSEGVQFNANQLQAGQGSGLGLFISKGLAEQHGGTLSVSSEGLGQGATFTLELPLFRLPPDLTTVRPFSESHSEGEPSDSPIADINSVDNSELDQSPSLKQQQQLRSSGGMIQREEPALGRTIQRILVVDDALSNRKLLMRILKAKGYMCEGAEDGQKAIEAYTAAMERNEPFEMILCDFEMPVMNGPEAVQKIRELGCECFIVGITGNVMQQDIDYFKDHGANAVLAKPLNVDAFESMFKKFKPGQQESCRTAKGNSTATPSARSRKKGKWIDASTAPAAVEYQPIPYKVVEFQVHPISEA